MRLRVVEIESSTAGRMCGLLKSKVRLVAGCLVAEIESSTSGGMSND